MMRRRRGGSKVDVVRARTLVASVTLALAAASLAACAADDAGVDGRPAPADPQPAATEQPATTAQPAATAPGATATTTTPPTEPAGAAAAGTDTDAIDTGAIDRDATDTSGASAGGALTPRELVAVLASDELGGRDNLTADSVRAQDILIGQLEQFADPARPVAGEDGYRQPFYLGANIVGVVPGGDLADEWVVVGAHFDHLGSNCPTTDPSDHICNGAVDNATSVAAAMEVARTIAAEGTPRRSLLVAFWDAEEDGLRGSRAYTDDPVVPLDSTVAYLNFEMLGVNRLPGVDVSTVAVGAETGGPQLVDALAAASTASSLATRTLGLQVAEGRSDYVNFVRAGVPIVHFIDGITPCYHTAQDEIDIVNFDKLDQEILTATALVRELLATDDPPVFDGTSSAVSFDDAETLLAMVEEGDDALDLLSPVARADAEQFQRQLEQIVAAGPDAFDQATIDAMTRGAQTYGLALTRGQCSGYQPG
jgi:hypothetical protein